MIEKINKLSLPATILIGCIILGCFYYFSEQGKIAEKMRIEEKVEKEKQTETFDKMLCVSQAETIATNLYKDFCTPANYCTYKEGTFLTAQYDSAYNRCLQSKGLK